MPCANLDMHLEKKSKYKTLILANQQTQKQERKS
jgi:hypothetical protein